jgi:V8-like Glu-specific endopeptidase
MTRIRLARIGMGAVVTTLAAAALGTASAAAAPAPAATTQGTSVSSTPKLTSTVARLQSGNGTEATNKALAAYWTPARMQAAKNADGQPGLAKAAKAASTKARSLAKAGTRPAVNKAPALKVTPQAPKGQTLAPAGALLRPASWVPNYPASAPVARTYGKVFFTNTQNGLNYVCSATVVNSEGRDTVWTAGHCVHGGSGGAWHANWTFVPAYNAGSAPYGYWSSNQLWTRSAWISSSDFTQDMGVAILNTNGGWHIVDRVGGQGIAWNYSKDYYAYDFGYPQAAPFNGSRLIACAGTTAPEWSFFGISANTIKLSCDMTGGSSGGAWLRWFDGNWGYINGLNSYKYNNDPNTMYSPYFGDAASSLYNAVRYL